MFLYEHKNKDMKVNKESWKKETSSGAENYAPFMPDAMANQYDNLSGYYPTDIRKHSHSASSLPIQTLAPLLHKEEAPVIQCFRIEKQMPYIPPGRRPANPQPPPILWDSDWHVEIKSDKVRTLAADEFDTVIDGIRRLIPTDENALAELELVITLYNSGHNALPQSKSMEDAPSMLAFSGGERSAQSSEHAVSEHIKTLGRNLGFTALSVPGISKYSEDVIEGLRSGYIGTRVSMGTGMAAAILAGRKERGIAGMIPDTEVGAAAEDGKNAKSQSEKLLTEIEAPMDGPGLLTGHHVYLRCPIEGGNMLTGSDFIIVGMDSLYATMKLYHTDSTVAAAMMGRDFNIPPEKVFIVEQPGEFHLDMAMTLVTGKTVLIKRPDETRRGKLIEKTINDLKSYGFTVLADEGLAVGGGFNFLNGEFVKSSDGRTYFLTNEPEHRNDAAKEAFKGFLRSKFPAIADVFFVPHSLSTSEKGGLGCRIKGMPGAISEVITRQRVIPDINHDSSTGDEP